MAASLLATTVEIERVKSATWGTEIREDVFKRWSQGFSFSSTEPISLVQYSGGPCAVLAPVQAFILQKHLFDSDVSEKDRESENWRKCTDVEAKTLLLKALSAILSKATSNGHCKVACFEDKSLNNVLHKDSQTVMSVVNKEKQGVTSLRVKENKKNINRLKRKYPFSTEEDEDENGECGSSSKKEIVSCISPSPSIPSSSLRTPTTSMSISVDEIDRSIRSSATGGSRISKGYLSSVLFDIQQNGGSNISLTNTSSSSNTSSTSSSSTISSSMLSLSTALSSLTVPPELLMKTPSSSLHQSPSIRQSISNMTNTIAMTSNSPTCSVSNVRPVIHNSTTVSSTQSRHNRKQRNPPNGVLNSTSIVTSKPSSSGMITDFHMNLKIVECPNDNESILDCLRDNIEDLEGPFGVILFLYSVILSKGIAMIMEEREEREQPLIDPIHGHGSQSLVNLLLVGCAVTNVFDLDRDLGGIKLKGIPSQSNIGFLTLLEALRYCQVGSFLKTPVYPVWLIGSETHLTVLFSTEAGLMSLPDPQAAARREFSKFDPDGIGIIDAKLLGELLENLKIESNPEFVLMVEEKLDDEHSGVILLHDFLEEFFPKMDAEPLRAFPVYHYNGSQQSFEPGKVIFSRGNAFLLDETGSTNTECSLINCLHTKWPNLVVHWDNHTDPKII